MKKGHSNENGLPLFPEFVAQPEGGRRAKARRQGFFASQQTASAVKSQMVVSYFKAWANVMKFQTRLSKIGYFDFFSGPGVYDDGTESTPVQVMRVVLADERLRSITLSMFEDKDPEAVDSLSKALASLDDFQQLKYPPLISHGDSVRREVEKQFSTKNVIPTFMFLDPFGYVGLTRDLMRAILKDWGCEIAFYFNFNRINAALRNSKVRAHMDALFGSDRVDAARTALADVTDENTREEILLRGVRGALTDIGAKYVLGFRFRKGTGALDHHLVFATKNILAQKIMKSIMASVSSGIDADGVASFEYGSSASGLALHLSDQTPMMALKRDLLERFKGQTLTVSQIYEAHNDDTPFTMKNYQDALRALAYDEGAIKVERDEFMPVTDMAVRKRHMSEKYSITFPA